MHKIKTFLLILASILLWSVASEARVCFLAGGSGEGDESLCLVAPKFESTACPGHTICDIPKSGARSCTDNGVNYYLPEDCCSSSVYTRCDSATGKVCTGAVCLGTDGTGSLYEACESGQCSCDSSYSETCAAADGLVGIGTACNGKYQSCQCNTNFFACDASATCEGSSCNDSRGELCTSCVCPVADGSEWVSDPDTCCWGYSSTCTNRPGGSTVYRCKTSQPRDCTCGYSYSTNKTGCINGCTDSNYLYQGNIPPHVVCNDYTSGIKLPCGNDCTCEAGYWDFYDQCPKQNANICAELGYTETSCSGKWIGCPYDASAKKCLNICPSGTFATQEECAGNGSLPLRCYQTEDGCWKVRAIAKCMAGTYTTEEACKASGSRVISCTLNGNCWSPSAWSCTEGTYTSNEACLASSNKILECEADEYGCFTPSKWVLTPTGECCKGVTSGYKFNCRAKATGVYDSSLAGQPLPTMETCSDSNMNGLSAGRDSGFIYGNWSCTRETCGSIALCQAGYAKSADDCGSTGSLGWKLSMINKLTGCGKCTAKTCDSSYNLSTDCSLGTNPMLCQTCYAGDTKHFKKTSCFALGFRCDCGTTCSNTDLSPDGLKRCLCMANIDPLPNPVDQTPDLQINSELSKPTLVQ